MCDDVTGPANGKQKYSQLSVKRWAEMDSKFTENPEVFNSTSKKE